LLSWDHIK